MLPLCPDVVCPPVVVFVPVCLPDVACPSRYGLSFCCSLCVYLSDVASLSRIGLSSCCNLCSYVYVCCCLACGGCLVFVWPPVAVFVSTFCSLSCSFLTAVVCLVCFPLVIYLSFCYLSTCLSCCLSVCQFYVLCPLSVLSVCEKRVFDYISPSVNVCVCVCVCAVCVQCVFVCSVCMCVWERERERVNVHASLGVCCFGMVAVCVMCDY